MTVHDQLFVREIVLSNLLRHRSFESALNCVAKHVIRTGVPTGMQQEDAIN